MPENKKSSEGQSLVEITVAVGVGAIALFGVAQLFSLTEKHTSRAYLQTVLDTNHIRALQYARSPAQLYKLLNLSSNPGLAGCLGRKGSSCGSYAVTNVALTDPAGVLNGRWTHRGAPCSGGVGCVIQQTTTYSLLCPSGIACDKIRISVHTLYSGNEAAPITKDSQIDMPGTAIVSHGKIDFGCALSNPGSFITGIDYETMTASCDPQTGTFQCAAGNSLTSFGDSSAASDCQATANLDCSSSGFSNLGLYSGQPQCQAANVCNQGVWVNGACGGICAANERRQTRTVSPVGCDATSQCVADPTCSPVVNCAGHWGSCPKSCGGTPVRTYVITSPALNGGAPCPFANGQTQACPPKLCKVNGSCGLKNGATTFMTTPSGPTLCAAGKTVGAGGHCSGMGGKIISCCWNWTCSGTGGGTSASCWAGGCSGWSFNGSVFVPYPNCQQSVPAWCGH